MKKYGEDVGSYLEQRREQDLTELNYSEAELALQEEIAEKSSCMPHQITTIGEGFIPVRGRERTTSIYTASGRIANLTSGTHTKDDPFSSSHYDEHLISHEKY